MKKILPLFVLLFSLLFIKPVFADEDFDISANTIYTVTETGNTTIAQKITIENKKEFIYTPSYAVTVGLEKVYNVKVFDNSGNIPFRIKENQDETTIEATFRDKTVGVGKKSTFTISFDTDTIAKKNGTVWEVDIPGLSDPDAFSSYNSTLQVPASFHDASIIKPQRFTKLSPISYSFSKNDIGNSGIFMIFGNSQYYKFKLDYHISNSNLFPIKTEIALPPSTGYQDVSIQKINPPPKNVYEDQDGNWLAVYELLPSQKQTITVSGVVKILSSPLKEPMDSSLRQLFTKNSQYWNTDNPEIKKLAQNLKTPKNIYDYVVSTLSYNYNKVSDTNARLGAVNVLKNPSNAVCLEFTDLFVALARAAGIPSRSVEGYAFTQNSKLKPLSLVKDVLHAWPEYYDEERQAWVMVDPTWGNTTKGSDYFNTFDYDHITFVINGVNSSYPIPAGGYKFSPDSKDVDVSFADESDFLESTQASVTLSLPEFSLTGLPVGGYVSIKNLGTIAIKNREISVKSDLSPNNQVFTVDSIPPYGTKEVKLKFDSIPLFQGASSLTTKEYQVTILFDGNTIRKIVKIGFFTEQMALIVGGGVFVAIIIIFIVAFKTRRVPVQG